MAVRPVFIPMREGLALVRTAMVEFTWHAGLAVSQKRKSVASLHEAAHRTLRLSTILEVSSKSEDSLGIALSAFNLTLLHPQARRPVSVECAFQAAKVFQEGGPYFDLLDASSRDAKRDLRLRSSGELIAFRFDGQDWPLEPQTAFYDWLYLDALRRRPEFAAPVMAYQAFTDIEFNPQASINCQAYSIALCTALAQRGILDETMASREAFLTCVRQHPVSNGRQDNERQGFLF